MKVLIIGGTGVFGSRLAKRLVAGGHDVILGSRNAKRGRAVAADFGATWIACDIQSNLKELFKTLKPDIVVDAAGPFQAYGHDPYKVLKAAIAHSIGYLDFSDDAAFTVGVAEFDEAAKQAGVAALSGVSSVPAISSAIVQDLASDLNDITLIESAILPGNKAPRGRSVMAAILSQIGERVSVWRGNAWTNLYGWSKEQHYTLPGGITRKAAVIGAPDLLLFPHFFKARSVLFRAGLELPLFHQTLRLASWLKRRRLAPNLQRFTPVFHWLADRLETFGTDTGGMIVRVCGRTYEGLPVEKIWRVLVQSGDGPEVPTLAAAALIDRWHDARPNDGARACVAVHSHQEINAYLTQLDTQIDVQEHANPTVFEQALGQDFRCLPKSVQRLHDIWDMDAFSGKAEIVRGAHPLVPVIAWAFGFPKAAQQSNITVEMERMEESERWTRRFGQSQFQSVLTVVDTQSGKPRLFERFGMFKAELDVAREGQTLLFPVKQAWLCGIPLPKWLTPISISREYDDAGRFHFDVSLALPLIGQIIRYRGWLTPRRAHTKPLPQSS